MIFFFYYTINLYLIKLSLNGHFLQTPKENPCWRNTTLNTGWVLLIPRGGKNGFLIHFIKTYQKRSADRNTLTMNTYKAHIDIFFFNWKWVVFIFCGDQLCLFNRISHLDISQRTKNNLIWHSMKLIMCHIC